MCATSQAIKSLAGSVSQAIGVTCGESQQRHGAAIIKTGDFDVCVVSRRTQPIANGFGTLELLRVVLEWLAEPADTELHLTSGAGAGLHRHLINSESAESIRM